MHGVDELPVPRRVLVNEYILGLDSPSSAKDIAVCVPEGSLDGNTSYRTARDSAETRVCSLDGPPVIGPDCGENAHESR